MEANGFQIEALRLFNGFLPRKKWVKLNETFSSQTDIEYGVPQGSILGTLLFNIYFCVVVFTFLTILTLQAMRLTPIYLL